MTRAPAPGQTTMPTTTSLDGTTIAYETTGQGPVLILVDGALCYRGSGPARPLAAELSEQFTVYTYDRRGRGESRDATTYDPQREVEDIQALIDVAGGSAALYGISSGGVLALDAAAHCTGVTSVAVYEPPFIVDDSRPPAPADYRDKLAQDLAAGRPGDAVKRFMRLVGVPGVFIGVMQILPMWKKLKAVAPTLRYDAAVMGETQSGRPLPRTRWAGVAVPALVVAGGKSDEWMHRGAHAVAGLLPDSRFSVLDGQNHMVKAKALAPTLAEFFAAQRAVPPRSITNGEPVSA